MIVGVEVDDRVDDSYDISYNLLLLLRFAIIKYD